MNLIFLPPSSPHLNPLEKVWDFLKWIIVPIIVQNEDEFFELLKDTFDRITNRISFAKKWCQKLLSLHKLF
ncbi:hypothetical protein EGH24_08260 [Halonotius terrestris]|uniref:Tc1-like transposase DDE domain-containing protein n=1 Tax=Halonotius terrestris TaxID=2487750 RepID=A0A8J8PA04_9EURY|nr:hypothetical protein EGH24_08260 [Halonotius terrestris]